MTKLERTPKLAFGRDEDVAEQLRSLHTDAQTGLRRVVAFGLFCFEIKMRRLKKGEFGKWLHAHAPEFAREDSKTGEWKASSTLSSWMGITGSVLKKMHLTVGEYLDKANSQNLGIAHGGEILLLPEPKVPQSCRKLREEICDIVDGKTAHQLMLEFAQADEDDEGNLSKRRGRTKGCKGTTKEQRQAAREREEQERIEGIELDTQDHDKWMEKNGGPKGVGLISANRFKKHLATVEWYYGVLKTLSKQRGEV